MLQALYDFAKTLGSFVGLITEAFVLWGTLLKDRPRMWVHVNEKERQLELV
jgi:hypothetical protein